MLLSTRVFANFLSVSRCLCLLFSVSLISQVAIALPVEAEMDRLVQAVDKHISSGNDALVADYVTQIEALPLAPPAKFYYLKGLILQKNNNIKAAKAAFEQYVDLVGSEEQGAYYWEALEEITAIEEIESNQPASVETEALVNSLLSDSALEERSAYENKLKTLYLTDSLQEALIQHINTLLASSVYTGSRVNSAEALENAVKYSVSINDDAEILTLEKDATVTPESLTTERFSPFGKTSEVSYQCDYKRAICSIRMPDTIDTWMKIGYSESAAEDISDALSRLVKHLQQSNAAN